MRKRTTRARAMVFSIPRSPARNAASRSSRTMRGKASPMAVPTKIRTEASQSAPR